MHVPERLESRHELDVALRRVAIELAELAGVHRRGALSNRRMSPKAKDMLGVEHEHVELEPNHEVDELEERLHRRHLAARDVNEKTALEKVWPVVNIASPDAGFRELRKRFDPVAKPCRTFTVHRDALAPHPNAIALPVAVPLAKLDPRPEIRDPRMRLDGQEASGALRDRVTKRARGPKAPVVALRRQDDGGVFRDRKGAVAPSKLSRRRNERRHFQHAPDSS